MKKAFPFNVSETPFAYFNCAKSAVIHFGNENPQYTYYANADQIPLTVAYKDLGILVDRQFSFGNHISNLAKKAYILTKIISTSFSKSNPLLTASIYKKYVLPTLTYGCPFFYPHSLDTIDSLERIQKRFSKICLPSHLKKQSYAVRLAFLDQDPIELVFLKTALSFLYKISLGTMTLTANFPSFFFSSSRNANCKFILPACKSQLRKSLFPCNVLSIWNSLPVPVQNSSSLALFRQRLQRIDFSSFLKGRTLITH